MKKGETRLENQQKTESPQVKQEEAKQDKFKKEGVKAMHEVKQNMRSFKCESEERAIYKGCLKKKLSAKTKKKASVILFLNKKMNNVMRFLEMEVVRQYVDTYSR